MHIDRVLSFFYIYFLSLILTILSLMFFDLENCFRQAFTQTALEEGIAGRYLNNVFYEINKVTIR